MFRTIAVYFISSFVVLLPLAFFYDGGVYLFTPVKQALLASLGLILAVLFFADRWYESKRLRPADTAEWLLVFFLIWMGIAGVFKAVNNWDALITWFMWLAAVGAFWFVRRSELRGFTLGAVVTGALLATFIGYGQLMGIGLPMSTDQYGETLPTSTFGHANYAAQAVLAAFAGGVGLLLAARRRWGITAGAMLMAITAPYLVLTGSRAAWGAAVAAIFLIVFLSILRSTWQRRKRGFVLLGLLAMLIAGVLLARPEVPGRMAEVARGEGASTATRLAVWRDSYPLVLEAPVLGFGPGQYIYRFTDFWSDATAKRVFASGPHLVENPHADWVAWALEGGLPAVLALALAVLLLLWKRWRGPWSGRAPDGVSAVALGIVFAWAIYGWVDYPLHTPFPLLGFFIALGAIAPLFPSDDSGVSRRNRIALALALLMLLVCSSYIPRILNTIRGQSLAVQAKRYVQVDPERALQLSLEAVDADPYHAVPFTTLGQAKLSIRDATGDLDIGGAIYFLQEALERFPNDFTARYNLGVALYEDAIERGSPLTNARQAFRRALAVNPYYGKAYFQLASIDARENQPWRRVRRSLDRAIKLEPPLYFAAKNAPEFQPYRVSPQWGPWLDNLRQKLNIRRTR